MIKRNFLAFLLLLATGMVWANGGYPVSKISPALLKGANAVLRLEEMRFEISGTKETTLRNHYVITILNENGDRWAELVEYYNSHREVTSIEGNLYDANGKLLKKLKNKDVMDRSGVSEANLMDDLRLKTHNFYHKNYPYTIEYIIDVKNKSTLFFPRWVPQGGEHLSVEKSSMHIVTAPDYEVRYKMFNYPGKPVATQEKNKKVLTWSMQTMPAISREAFSPLWHDLTTMVIFGPTEFQMDNYKGNMKNWEEFGKFVYALTHGRDQLPENVKQTVHSITGKAGSAEEKVTRLYEYMQSNTRYISIQLGIGGWQPFPASDVAAKGYGDCKALTNYMYSLLKEAGIPSYYTLIRAGENANYITEDFPSQQFNHVILAVPMQKDTIWLECTSQTMPAGYLGDFTSDRPALMIDQHGGKMVRTPKYGVMQNLQERNVKAVLDESGTLSTHVLTRYTGLQQDNIHGMINALNKEKVKEILVSQLDFSTYDINEFDYKQEKRSLPAINESLDITVSNYATITGKRLFITPNVMTRTSRKLSENPDRKYDLHLGFEYRDVDSVVIDMPAGYEPESIPKEIVIESKFGKYQNKIELRDNKLYYFRIMEEYGGKYPAGDYDELAKFFNAAHKADRNRIVLVKKDVPDPKAF